jgi:hypothetical protein
MAAPNSPTVEESLGVNIHFVDSRPGEVRMIADAGFRWVRTDFKWDVTERDRGRYDFSSYDRLLKELEANHLRALFILDYGNPLYTEGMSVRTAEARHAFAKWSVAAAKHFAGRGIVWEVFNEPNIPVFWPPDPDVQEYVALAAEVSRAFQAEAPAGNSDRPGDFENRSAVSDFVLRREPARELVWHFRPSLSCNKPGNGSQRICASAGTY